MIVDFLALLGSLSFLIASIGLLRMPDSFGRIHSATKASSLGVIFFTVAAALEFPTPGSIFIAFMTAVLVFLTAPMACQAIASRLIPAERKEP